MDLIQEAPKNQEPLTKEEMKLLLEKAQNLQVHGSRILVVEFPKEEKIGRIYMPQNAQDIHQAAAKKGMVIRPSKDIAVIIQNNHLKAGVLQAAGFQMTDESLSFDIIKSNLELEVDYLPVSEVHTGDLIYYPPIGQKKIGLTVGAKALSIDVIDWSDVLAIEPKSD